MATNPTLPEEHRSKLDGIVQQMITNNESDENIQWVVNDFKQKYSTPSPLTSAQMTPVTTGQADVAGLKLAEARMPTEVEVPEPKKQGMTVSGFAGNVSRDVGEMYEGYKQLVTHPVETAKGLGQLGMGVYEKATGQDTPRAKVVGDIGTSLVEAVKHPMKTFYEEPVDVLSFLSLGAGATSKLAKVGKAGKVATALEKTSQILDPVNTAVALAKVPFKASGFATKQFLGLLTGKGGNAVGEWQKGSVDFYKAMRGKISETDVVNNVRGALDNIRRTRSKQFANDLENLTMDIPLGYNKVYGKLDDIVSEFKLPSGKLNLKPEDLSELNRLRTTIDDFSKNTYGQAIDLHALKQHVRDFYTPNSAIGKIATELADDINITLSTKVNGYATMNAKYKKITDIANEMEKSLVGTSRSSRDTSLKKLMSTMKEDPQLRRDLMTQMQDLSGTNIQSQIAGIMAKDYLPGNYIGRVMDVGVIFGSMSKAIDPTMISVLALSSPRVMAEFLGGLGWTSKQIKPVIDFFTKTDPALIRQGLYMAGKLEAQQSIEKPIKLDANGNEQ